MKKNKIALLTLYGNNNYGNKLQNYASQVILNEYFDEVITIKNRYKSSFKKKVKNIIKIFLSIFIKKYKYNSDILNIFSISAIKRYSNFKKFDSFINKSSKFEYINCPKNDFYYDYDYYCVGSDQVWNPGEFPFLPSLFLLKDLPCSKTLISLSSSISQSKLSDEQINSAKSSWLNFKAISVREKQAKKIIEKTTNRKDVEVFLDPTMLIDKKYWNDKMEKPSNFDSIFKDNKRFILNYFLGKCSDDKRKQIQEFAKKNHYNIINLLDPDDPFYISGPSEFLWLEKNAELICTDSFHSSVFAILFNKPFLVYDRDDKMNKKNNMNSRLDTLLDKFALKNRYYHGILDENSLNWDSSNIDFLLEEEKRKVKIYLDKAFCEDELKKHN